VRRLKVADMPEQVGFIGLGIMGSLQAMNLAKAGYELTVFNRTREKAEQWVKENGGAVADSPQQVAESSDVVITMVVDGAQVTDMVEQALPGARERTLFIDMSTIAPGTARALDERLREQGHAFVDAPVTGSSPKARTGTLTIMCGGAPEDLERARPLFEVMGEKIVVCGEAGQGQAVKVITQAITAVNCATLAQGLVLARQAGVDVDALLETMDGGSSDSTMRALKGRPMLEHDFTPLFKLAHMLKDVQLCLAEARTAGSAFPFAGLAAELYGAGVGRGLGEQDFAAVLEVVEGLNGARV
jgi:3-hydroxyisobutyrate dehydrogenase-like beta-hydroxyacid dehydrogenase